MSVGNLTSSEELHTVLCILNCNLLGWDLGMLLLQVISVYVVNIWLVFFGGENVHNFWLVMNERVTLNEL